MTPLPPDWAPLLRRLVNAGYRLSEYAYGHAMDTDDAKKRMEALACAAEWENALDEVNGKMKGDGTK